jgi:hypothetical protein
MIVDDLKGCLVFIILIISIIIFGLSAGIKYYKTGKLPDFNLPKIEVFGQK